MQVVTGERLGREITRQVADMTEAEGRGGFRLWQCKMKMKS